MELREVGRNAVRLDASVKPLANVGAGCLENVEVQVADGAFAFQNRNEVHRRDDCLVANPADKRFGAHKFPGEQVDLGLVEDHEFLVADGIVEFVRNFLLVHRADKHFLGEKDDIACLDGPCGLQRHSSVVQRVVDFDFVFDGVDAHARLDANIQGLGTLAKSHFAVAELGNEFFLMLLLGENEKVVTAESCNDFLIVDELGNLVDVHLEGEVALLAARRLVDVLEILQVNKVGGVICEVSADDLLAEHEDACLVVGPGHGVGNGCLAGISDQVGSSGEDEKVPAEQLHELLFVVGEAVAVYRVGLERKGSLLAGTYGFREVGRGRDGREPGCVVVGREFARNSVGGELAYGDIVNAVDVADVCLEGKVYDVSCHDAEYFICTIDRSKELGPKVKIHIVPQ